MDILVTGRIESISSSFYNKLAEKNRVVASSHDIDFSIVGDKCDAFRISVSESGFEKLFNTYSFDTVIYFAGRPEVVKTSFNDVEELEALFRICSAHGIIKVIYISSTYIYSGLEEVDETSTPMLKNGGDVARFACETLCETYRKKGMAVLVLHTPCMFGKYENSSFVGRLLYQVATKNSLYIAGTREQPVDFLAIEDLARLISLIILQFPTITTVINLQGAYSCTLGDVAEMLKNVVHSTRISFSETNASIYEPMSSSVVYKMYDWRPVIKINEKIGELFENVKSEKVKKRKGFRNRLKDFYERNSMLTKAVELAGGFALSEYLVMLSDTAVYFKYVDFRLIFVVVIGAVHGMTMALSATVLAIISCIFTYFKNGAGWQNIIFDEAAWIPVAVYIIIGAFIGYFKEKYDNEIRSAEDEKKSVEEGYLFVSKIYSDVLKKRDDFKHQIVGYRNSFGRIFDIVKRLNTVNPEALYREALYAIEDILEIKSIAVYSISHGTRFGRLRVCSADIMQNMPKSVDMTGYGAMVENFAPGKVWVNRDCLDGYPDFAYPIYSDGVLVSAVFANKVPYEQMTVYFENMMKIVCGLIEDALLRAYEYNEKLGDERYYPNTRIMRPDAFHEMLELQDAMEEEVISGYELICVTAEGLTIQETADKVKNIFRDNDIFGDNGDGRLYIILSQANKSNLPEIRKRIEERGVECTMM